MITKVYEVTCDKCGVCINHYIRYKPTMKELRHDCGKVIIRNGKIITICDKCIKTL